MEWVLVPLGVLALIGFVIWDAATSPPSDGDGVGGSDGLWVDSSCGDSDGGGCD